MIYRYYADVLANGDVHRIFSVEDNEVGPLPLPYCEGEARYIGTTFAWGAATYTCKMVWSEEERQVVWVSTLSVGAAAELAIQAIDREGDAARLRVIGDSTKALEYQRAEAQARPYAAAGYPDPVPDCVLSWADAKRWTNGGVPWSGQRAADDIIVTADLWNAGLEGIRRLRLDAKEHVRAIARAPDGTPQEIEAVQRQFSADLSNLMKGLP